MSKQAYGSKNPCLYLVKLLLECALEGSDFRNRLLEFEKRAKADMKYVAPEQVWEKEVVFVRALGVLLDQCQQDKLLDDHVIDSVVVHIMTTPIADLVNEI